MKTPIKIIILLLLVSSAANAGSVDETVDTIVDQVQQLINTLQEGKDQISRNAGDEIKDAVGNLSTFLNERRELIEEFEDNQAAFKSDLGDALGAFGNLTNELLLLPDTTGAKSDVIDLQKAITAIESLPDGLTAPLWLVMEKQLMFSKSSFADDVNAAATTISVVKPMLLPAQDPVKPDVCEHYKINRDLVDNGKTKLLAAGISMKVFGKLLIARGETKLVPEGGFWGFANASWESSPPATWGHRIEVVGDLLFKVRASVVAVTNRCAAIERHELVVANQELILVNQQAILDMQEMFAMELAAMNSRLRPPAKKK
jgi:ElaB/YqjD/DUF883 family membrane-anchored ribosome-binding protein